MYSNVHEHVSKRIKNTEIILDPYPHFVIDNIFTQELYNQLILNPISDNALTSLKNYDRVGAGYSDSRKILKMNSNMPYLDDKNRLIWQNFTKYIINHFVHIVLQKFKLSAYELGSDLLYVRDKSGYSLGPHTDKPSKVLTCLFYLPKDDNGRQFGTSIYLPKDKNFVCSGGPHYKREGFNLYKTIEYLPNRLFCFLKNNKSFHGVEPISEVITRDLIIFDLQKPE